MNTRSFKLQFTAWSLAITTSALAVIVWALDLGTSQAAISSYKLFPLFGLLAFSLMWGHYIVAALRQTFKIDRVHLRTYFSVTSWAVLTAILLHPGLLMWQLWRDGFGLPPNSVTENYVGEAMGFAVSLGTISLLAFLLYELHRFYREKSWWKYVQFASDLAMVAILYHSWQLGSHVQDGWYAWVWSFYTVTFFVALGYTYFHKLNSRTATVTTNP